MSTAPALSVARGRPSKESSALLDLRMDVHALKGDMKRTAIEVGRVIHDLTYKPMTPEQREQEAERAFGSMLRLLKAAGSI